MKRTHSDWFAHEKKSTIITPVNQTLTKGRSSESESGYFGILMIRKIVIRICK